MWIIHNKLEEIWMYFKPEVTEADQKKIAINDLDDEARQKKKQFKAKMKVLKGKVNGSTREFQ